jgi:hypothetical protein
VADKAVSDQFERWIGIAGTVVAPVTLLSTLLFYFGYVSSRSQYEYFGLDVDTIGLSTQDYVMRSPQPLLVPLLTLALAGAGLLMVHVAIRRRVLAATVLAAGGKKAAAVRIGRAVWALSAIGMALLGAGVVLLFAYGYVREWVFYGLVTPLLLTAGAAFTAYAARIRRLLNRLPGQAAPATAQDRDTAPERLNDKAFPRRVAAVLIYVVIAAGLLWATATVAQWSGRGLAQYDAQHLGRLPSVILDTKERLYLRVPGVEETILPRSEGQTFHYRYRRLRLLIQGRDRMFLVPEKWSASGTTLVLQLDGAIRVQFQFQNIQP